MAMRYLILTSILLLSAHLSAQKYDYIWRHGYNSPFWPNNTHFFIDFNTFPPTIKPTEIGESIYVTSAGTVVSDKEGVFSWFSDECSIFNKSGQTMQGGQVLNPGPIFDHYCKPGGGGYPMRHGMFALPDKGNQYTVFHQRSESQVLGCLHPDLLSTQVDMSQNNGYGAVINANKQFFRNCLLTLSANQHANGRDWWLLVASTQVDTFYRFLFIPGQGVQGPWKQHIENPAKGSLGGGGWSEFSADGRQYLNHSGISGISVYDFDRCTGLLSNLRYISAPPGGDDLYVSAVFSPNGRFVYACVDEVFRVEQFDLWASDIEASRTLLATWEGEKDAQFQTPIGFTDFQHGPDGKLYIWSGTRYMHVINYPDRLGAECGFRRKAINLPGTAWAASFYYPHYRLGPLDGSPCDTLGLNNLPHAEYRYDLVDSTQAQALQFTDVSWYAPTTWHWDFGDPTSGSSNTSTEQNPVHTFSQSGIYTVCLLVSNPYAADTICKQVTAGMSNLPVLPALPQAQVFPNPITDALTVRLPSLPSVPFGGGGESPLRFLLTDALGRTLRQISISDLETLVEVSGLPAGMYFWQLRLGGETVQSGRVVKGK